MAPQRKNIDSIIGKKFHMLTVIREAPFERFTRVVVRCDCGNEKTLVPSDLKRGNNKSCGCDAERARKQAGHDSNVTHGLSQIPEYAVWFAAKHRCTCSSNKQYKDYGGRGIKMCEQWLNSFEQFLNDMGKRPAGLTLERINNNGNYEQSNCKWTTTHEQRMNQRGMK